MSLVTAVITTHKREPEIVERALKSILNQTYKEIEIIIVDDSPSSYELRESVKAMACSYTDKGVRYIQHETCQGACAARNTGLHAANGEYIGYLDDDDEWLPEKVEKQLKGFVDDNIALVYCSAEIYDTKTQTTTKKTVQHHRGNVFDKLIIDNFIGSTSFPLIRKNCLLSIDGFDVLMQSVQDFDVYLRLSRKYSFNYVEDVLARYYVHGTERISTNSKKRIAGLERIIKKNEAAISKNRKIYWSRYSCLIVYYAKNGQRRKAFSTWLKCSIRCPLKIKENLRYLYAILRTKKDR